MDTYAVGRAVGLRESQLYARTARPVPDAVTEVTPAAVHRGHDRFPCMRPAPSPPTSPGRVGRRTAVAGAVATMALALAGCGVRLEDDAPPLPLIPTRDPVPAEPALLWLLADCRDLAEREGPHTGLYGEQTAVLRSALYRAGVPIETLDEVVAPRASSTTEEASATPAPGVVTTSPVPPAAPPEPTPQGGTATPSGGPTRVADDGPRADPGAALERVDDLAGCGPGIFPLVMSLLAQRSAVILVAGPDSPRGPAHDEVRIWTYPHLAGPFAGATDAAVYGFEIVAAQSRESRRESALTTLADLRRVRREQTVRAGGEVSPPAFGYPLPFPVDSEESAQRLAVHVLDGLADTLGGLLLTVTGAAQEDTAADVVAWLGAAAAHGSAWGVPLTAFPGMRPTP